MSTFTAPLALQSLSTLLPFARTTVWVERHEFTQEGEHIVSPIINVPEGNDSVVLSWNLTVPTPLHDRVEVEVRAKNAVDGWSRWHAKFSLDHGHWRSIKSPTDADVEQKQNMTHYQVRFRLTEDVTLHNAIVTFLPDQKTKPKTTADPYLTPGKRFFIEGVSQLQQMPENEQAEKYPRVDEKRNHEVGHLICSPVSLAMVLQYHGNGRANALAVARATYDPTTRYYGVWALNIAAVRCFLPAYGAVVKLESLVQLENQVRNGRPIIASIRWKEGELTNAPIPASGGHLVVVVGFTEEGNVLVHDPRSDELEHVLREYNREEFWNAWQNNATGIVYLVF